MESSSERQTQQWRHSQVTDYTMESTMPCWSDKMNTICYIHNVYKHIWGTKKYFVYLLTTLYKSVWHTSIANLSKRIHNSSPETLVYFFSNSENAQEGVREQDFLRQPNVLLQRKVYMWNKHEKTYTVWEDRRPLHGADLMTTSCSVYMRKLFDSTTLTGWTLVSMYRDRDDKHILEWYSFLRL